MFATKRGSDKEASGAPVQDRSAPGWLERVMSRGAGCLALSAVHIANEVRSCEDTGNLPVRL